jgi:hypothetical protein
VAPLAVKFFVSIAHRKRLQGVGVMFKGILRVGGEPSGREHFQQTPVNLQAFRYSIGDKAGDLA